MAKIDKRPHVLLTNDDGIDAPGLHALADALEPDFDILVVAPHRERSATGHAISVMKDLRLERYHRNGDHWGWSFQGKPADCVKVAATVIAQDKPIDLVLSGINRGQNLGINILYSGTVAAAREGVLLGIPSIAFSLAYRKISEMDWKGAAEIAAKIARRVYGRGLPLGVFLNVNVPPCPAAEIRGFAITRQGMSGFRDHFEHVGGDASSGALYRNIGERFRHSPSDDIDLDDRAIKHNRVSITPLHVDTTAHHALRGLADLAQD